MEGCGSCDLCHDRTKVVFGEGATNPLVMVVGEAPGEDEDTQGIPFVGKAGEKLNSILEYVGVTREEIYITNSVLCRPPNNRNPRAEELEACKWRLDLQIQLLKPKLVILLGKIATQSMQEQPVKGALSQFFPENLKEQKDGWLRYSVGGHEAKVLITYHPSYHLRSPERAYRTTLPHWTRVKKWVESERQAI
nr:uracil-DNA glycosylase [Hydrogenophaga sp.]